MIGNPRAHRNASFIPSSGSGRASSNTRKRRRIGRRRAVQPPEELHEFLTPVTAAAFADHDAIEHAQCGIQRGRPVADVVMGLAFGDAGPQGQHRARPVQRLDPTLLIEVDPEIRTGC